MFEVKKKCSAQILTALQNVVKTNMDDKIVQTACGMVYSSHPSG